MPNNDFLNQIQLKQHLTDEWIAPEDEGEMSVDIYETDDAVIIKAPLAGVESENIEIALHQDLLTIKGKRELKDVPHSANKLAGECFWGKFSRSILLPHHSSNDKVQAELKNGLLTIILPKAERVEGLIKVKTVD